MISGCTSSYNNIELPYEAKSAVEYKKEEKKYEVSSKLSDNKILEIKEASKVECYCIDETLVVSKGTLKTEDVKFLEKEGVTVLYTKDIKDIVEVDNMNESEVITVLNESSAISKDGVVIPSTETLRSKLEMSKYNYRTIETLYARAGVK